MTNKKPSKTSSQKRKEYLIFLGEHFENILTGVYTLGEFKKFVRQKMAETERLEKEKNITNPKFCTLTK